MSFGTRIIYGVVLLENCQTRRFEQTVERDESGADSLFNRFTISVESTIHDQAIEMGFLDPSLVNTATPTKAALLQAYLMHPRRTFEMYYEGLLWLSVGSMPPDPNSPDPTPIYQGRVDVANGPRVTHCNVVHVAGYKAFRVEITFEVCVILCAQGLEPSESRLIIHNRWSLEESIDESLHWHRTLTGRARVAHAQYWDVALRYLVTPRLSPYMQLTGVSYVQSRDALNLDYRISMKQRHAAPIPPAIDFQCTHAEETGEGGGQGMSNISIRMNGDPGDHRREMKQQLLVAAILILEARIGYALDKEGEESKSVFFVTNARLIDIVHTPDIELSLSLRRTYQQKSEAGDLNTTDRWSGLTWQMLARWPVNPDAIPNYRRDRWPEPIPFKLGDAGPAQMFQRMFQTPCGDHPNAADALILWEQGGSQEPENPNEDPPPPQSENPEPKLYISNPEGPTLSQEPPKSPLKLIETSSNMLVEAELESRYITDHGRSQLPKFAGESNETCVITRLHQPVTKRVVWYRAKRLGVEPEIPQILDSFVDGNDIAHKLDEEELLPSPPELSPDGTNYFHRVEMRLVYLCSRNIRAGDNLSAGSLPWDVTTPADNLIPYSEIQSDGFI